MAPSGPNPAQKREFTRLLSDAVAGRLSWLDELVRDAGYIHPQDGITQADLVRQVPRVTKSQLLAMETDGLPAVKKGRRKSYPVVQLIAFLYERYVRPGRRSSINATDDGDTNVYTLMDAKFRGLNRKLTYEERTRQVIPSAELDRALITLALEIRAALQSLPGSLAPQLEHQSTAAIRALLTQRIHWICQELAQGHVPVPEAAAQAIDAAIEQALAVPDDWRVDSADVHDALDDEQPRHHADQEPSE